MMPRRMHAGRALLERRHAVEVLSGAPWRVIQSDAARVARRLPAASLGAVIIDPPYCSGGYTEAARRQAKGQGLRSTTLQRDGWFINDNMTTAALCWLLREIACEAHRLLVPGGSLLVFTDRSMEDNLAPAIGSSGLRSNGSLTWDKVTPGLGRGFRRQSEKILHFCKGVGEFYRSDLGDVLRCPRVHASEREHQTEKPVALMADLVTTVAAPGSIVADFFCGSGSTGEAALVHGRRFLGVELLPENAAKASARLAAVAQQSTAAAAKAGQLSLLGGGS